MRSACECRKAWSLALGNRPKDFFFFFKPIYIRRKRVRWCNSIGLVRSFIFARSRARHTAIGGKKRLKYSRSRIRIDDPVWSCRSPDHPPSPHGPWLFLMFCTDCGRENGHSKRGKFSLRSANACVKARERRASRVIRCAVKRLCHRVGPGRISGEYFPVNFSNVSSSISRGAR